GHPESPVVAFPRPDEGDPLLVRSDGSTYVQDHRRLRRSRKQRRISFPTEKEWVGAGLAGLFHRPAPEAEEIGILVEIAERVASQPQLGCPGPQLRDAGAERELERPERRADARKRAGADPRYRGEAAGGEDLGVPRGTRRNARHDPCPGKPAVVRARRIPGD